MFKSHHIVDLWRFVVSHPDWKFQFYIGYEPISNDEFLKTYLHKTQSFTEYLFLYRALKPKITIHQWLTNRSQ